MYEELIETAKKYLKNSYAPYSGIHVAAAVMTTDGRIYVGVNVENSSYGLTICAERVAIAQAVTEGYRGFKAIAIVTDYEKPIPPCGACLQFMAEFCADLDIVLHSVKSGKTIYTTLRRLLPNPFHLIRDETSW